VEREVFLQPRVREAPRGDVRHGVLTIARVQHVGRDPDAVVEVIGDEFVECVCE
jgi:hypothetical protein